MSRILMLSVAVILLTNVGCRRMCEGYCGSHKQPAVCCPTPAPQACYPAPVPAYAPPPQACYPAPQPCYPSPPGVAR